MTKNEFNIGDKVVSKQYYDIDVNGYSTTIPIGEVGVIEYVNDDEILVSFGNYGVSLIRPISEFEIVKTLDRHTAFLTELQALLRKYDATIEVSPYYENEVVFSVYMNNEVVIHNQVVKDFTVDNIMDFYK